MGRADDAWKKFQKSGKVEDYLEYKKKSKKKWKLCWKAMKQAKVK